MPKLLAWAIRLAIAYLILMVLVWAGNKPHEFLMLMGAIAGVRYLIKRYKLL